MLYSEHMHNSIRAVLFADDRTVPRGGPVDLNWYGLIMWSTGDAWKCQQRCPFPSARRVNSVFASVTQGLTEIAMGA
jgi:hypothetical protein